MVQSIPKGMGKASIMCIVVEQQCQMVQIQDLQRHSESWVALRRRSMKG